MTRSSKLEDGGFSWAWGARLHLLTHRSDDPLDDVPGSGPGRDGHPLEQPAEIRSQGEHVTAGRDTDERQGLGGPIEVFHRQERSPQLDQGGAKAAQICARPAHPDRKAQFKGGFGVSGIVQTELHDAPQDLRDELRALGSTIFY